jgi:uncharacterized protein YoxC
VTKNSHKVEDKECVKVIEALKDIEYIKENLKELKEQHRRLCEDLAKKGEEIKDTFHIADQTRIAFEEHAQLYMQKLDDIKEHLKNNDESIEELSDTVNILKDSRYKVLFTIVKALGAGLLVGIVILKEFFGFFSTGG